jgi:hypothetical protein
MSTWRRRTTPVTPKFTSPADPASRWTGADKGLAFFADATTYLIDLDHAVIVDVEASAAGPSPSPVRPLAICLGLSST